MTINVQSEFPLESGIWSPKDSGYAFVSIPHNATHSVAHIIARSLNHRVRTPNTLQSYQEQGDWQKWNKKLYTFCILRNPYNRVVSYWQKKVDDTSFERWVLAGRTGYVNQHEIIERYLDLGIEIDLYLKLERLDTDWADVNQRTGLYWPPHHSASELHEQNRFKDRSILQAVGETVSIDEVKYAYRPPDS